MAAELVPFLRQAVDESPSDLVFPRPDGSMMPEDAPLEVILRTALARAGMVRGYYSPRLPQRSRQEHVFDRYWQAKETAQLGTGLGLSIARGLVELHGGRIWVAGQPGTGSTFSFSLPAEYSGRPAS